MCFPKEPAAGAASQKKKEEERREREEKEKRGREGKGRGRGEKERREEGERERREGKERGKGEGERRRGERRERGRGGKGGGKGRGGGEERGRRKEKGERKGERKEEGKRKEGKKGWWIIPRRCTAVTGGRLTTAYYCPKPRACRFRNNRAADGCSRIVPIYSTAIAAMRSDFLQNPVFLVAETGARRAPPPSERGALSLSFNRRIRNMSVGRFQLALRALDLRAAPCPRGLVRPSGSLAGAHFVAPNPALALPRAR